MSHNQLYYDNFNFTGAIQQALNNTHLDGIKYVYQKKQKDYLKFYDQYNITQAIQIAEKLKDVEGYKYIYNKSGTDYFSHLYSFSPQPSLQEIKLFFDKAKDYQDLQGIKYVVSQLQSTLPYFQQALAIISSYFSLDYKKVLYSGIQATTTDANIALDLFFAVQVEDLEGVKYILKEVDTFEKSNSSFPQMSSILHSYPAIISHVYYQNSISIAIELVKAGTKFEFNYIIRPPHNVHLNQLDLKNHLNELQNKGHIKTETHKQALALTDTMYGDPVKKLNLQEHWYSEYEIFASTMYTANTSFSEVQSIFKQYTGSQEQPILDALKITLVTNAEKKPISILSPEDQNKNTNFFHNFHYRFN